MRKQSLSTGEYYHVYNRGVDKRDIFSDGMDVSRFIESVCEFNNIDGIGSLANLRKSRKIQIESKPLSKPLVAIVAFCFNPNHFHFILKQLVDGGVAKFMQKLQGGYTYYFNIRNIRSGSLFQGTFKSHHIDDENYFRKMLGYVNNNNEVHDIPPNKIHLVFSSLNEYKNNNFMIVSKEEGERVLTIFDGGKNFLQHCKEIVSIARKEKGKLSLLEEDTPPVRAEIESKPLTVRGLDSINK